MNLLQLNPPIWLTTPLGPAICYVLIDYGADYNLVWVCFLEENGECWSFDNTEVTLQENKTLGRNYAKRNKSSR